MLNTVVSPNFSLARVLQQGEAQGCVRHKPGHWPLHRILPPGDHLLQQKLVRLSLSANEDTVARIIRVYRHIGTISVIVPSNPTFPSIVLFNSSKSS